MLKSFTKRFGKRGLVISAAAMILLSFVTIGATLAYMTDSEETINNFTYGSIDVDLKEPKWDELGPEDKVVYPGRAIPKNPYVTNTGTVDIYAYLEVRIPMASVRTVSEDGTTIIPAKKQDLFTFTQSADWMKLEESFTDTDHVFVFAYKKSAIAPGEDSTPVFEEVRFINILEGELEEGMKFDIPVKTYVIQAEHLNVSGDTLAEKLQNVYLEHKALLKEGGSTL